MTRRLADMAVNRQQVKKHPFFTDTKEMKALTAIAIFFATLAACTKAPVTRSPSSIADIITVPSNLELASKELLDYLNSGSFTAQNCGPILQEIYSGVFNKNADYFDRTALTASALPILNNLWLAKLALREHIKGFTESRTITPECVHATRSILRSIRFVEDYIGEANLHGLTGKATKRKAFTGGFPSLMLNPNENDFELRSGDVLLSRGSAFTSAAIARIGDDDSQFSHLAMFYINEAGERFVVEAHIEIGSKVSTFDEYASDGKVRALVFRQPDKELAALAAKKIYEVVSKATASGKNVPYDFAMNLKNRDELFCSEVVEYGYELAAKELHRDFKMPLFLTTFSMKNRSFLEGIGVTTKETFAPADIETDTRFQLVAEWRDFGRIRTTHYHDAVLTQMFAWMEDYDYELKTDPITYLAKNVLWTVRSWPLFSELLKKKFPENMPKNAIGTMMLLDDVAGALFDELVDADDAYVKSSGLRMTPKQMRDHLNEFRKQDFELLKKYPEEQLKIHETSGMPDAPKFHWKFAPKN